MCFSDIVYSMVYCIFYGILYMYITKCGCVFLKLGESIYVAMDLIPILLGSLPLAHNASLVIIIICTCRRYRAANLPDQCRPGQMEREEFPELLPLILSL